MIDKKEIYFNKTVLLKFICSKVAGFRSAVYCRWTPPCLFCKDSAKVLVLSFNFW